MYSTNPWFAYDVCKRFRGGRFRVWCSEVFDPTGADRLTTAAAIGRTSSPRSIAETLAASIRNPDQHCDLIKNYKRTFKALAVTWHGAGEITPGTYGDMIHAVTKGTDIRLWRPVIYVIPRKPIEDSGRLEHVPAGQRAGYGPEYRIADLGEHEFDPLEMILC